MVLFSMDALGILMRWVHVLSAALLVGGTVYAWMIVSPAIAALPRDEQHDSWETLAARFRPMVLAAIVGLIVSGVYTFLTNPGHSRVYHIWLTVKVLLSIHVFTSILLAMHHPDDTRRTRRLASAAISGAGTLLVAEYLRRIF